jgi:uncharacterized protein (DUF486 family)
MWRALLAVAMLVISNTFMTFAWYYHVAGKKGTAWPLWTAILIGWLLAFPEYLFQVPANRLGHVDHGGILTLPQLKIIQEAITLVVFTAFVVLVTKERMRPNDYAAMALVMAAVVVSMVGRK